MAGTARLPEKLYPPRLLESRDRRDEDLLVEAMAGVRPLEAKPRVARRNGDWKPNPARDEASEGQRLMEDFVAGRIEFEWSFHPGYQEGGPGSTNRQLVRKLRRGGFAVQAEIDLHGMTQVEAQAALEAFVADCNLRNIRCIRVIHGKGNNSQNNEGVLKQRLPQWLATKRLGRLVLAFTSARPADGGLGATYVLLRKRP